MKELKRVVLKRNWSKKKKGKRETDRETERIIKKFVNLLKRKNAKWPSGPTQKENEWKTPNFTCSFSPIIQSPLRKSPVTCFSRWVKTKFNLWQYFLILRLLDMLSQNYESIIYRAILPLFPKSFKFPCLFFFLSLFPMKNNV